MPLSLPDSNLKGNTCNTLWCYFQDVDFTRYLIFCHFFVRDCEQRNIKYTAESNVHGSSTLKQRSIVDTSAKF